MPSSERPSYRKSLKFSVLSFGALVLLGLVSSIAIARLYGIEIVGENALTLAPILVLAYLSTVREQAGLVRELVALPRRSPRITALFYVVLAFSVGLTLIAAILVLVGTWLVFNGPVGRPDLFLPQLVQVAGFVVLTNTSWNLDMVFSAFRAGKELFHVRLWQALSFLALALSLGFVWRSVWALVLAMVGSLLTALVHRLILIPRFMGAAASRGDLRDACRTLPSIIRYGAKIAPGMAADGLAKASPTWVLGAIAPLAALGAFNRAATLGDRIGDVNVKVGEMLFPTLVERGAADDREGFGRGLVDTMRHLGAGVFLLAAAGGGAAHGVMDVFGKGFSQGAPALALLLTCTAVGSLATCITLALYAVERLVITTIIAGVRLLVVIPICIALSLWLGVTGAALSLLVTQIGALVWLVLVARRSLAWAVRKYWPVQEQLSLVAAYAAGLAAAGLVDIAVGGLGGTLAALMAGSLTYVLMFWGLGGINARDRQRIRSACDGWRARSAPRSTV